MSLESLPPELIWGIFDHVTDLGTLKAIVVASPVFHNNYLMRRHLILKRVIRETLGEAILPEALAIVANGPASAIPECQNPQDLRDLVVFTQLSVLSRDGVYGDYTAKLSIEDLPPDKVEVLAALHFAIEFFIIGVCILAASKFGSLAGGHRYVLTLIERGRLLRAIYRFQFYNSLSETANKPEVEALGFSLPSEFDDFHPPRLFIDLLSQWELEELSCVVVWFSLFYAHTFEESAEESSEQDRKTVNEGSHMDSRVLALDHYMLVLQKTSSSYLATRIKCLQDHLNGTCLSFNRVLRHRFNVEDYRDGTDFSGDSLTSPNVAWSRIRDMAKSQREHLDQMRLRFYGYVFWEESSFQKSNVTRDGLLSLWESADDERKD